MKVFKIGRNSVYGYLETHPAINSFCLQIFTKIHWRMRMKTNHWLLLCLMLFSWFHHTIQMVSFKNSFPYIFGIFFALLIHRQNISIYDLLWCLFIFDIRILITLLVSSNPSYLIINIFSSWYCTYKQNKMLRHTCMSIIRYISIMKISKRSYHTSVIWWVRYYNCVQKIMVSIPIWFFKGIVLLLS
jgi:hypothetical protein